MFELLLLFTQLFIAVFWTSLGLSIGLETKRQEVWSRSRSSGLDFYRPKLWPRLRSRNLV